MGDRSVGDDPLTIDGVSTTNRISIRQQYITPSNVAIPEYKSKRDHKKHQPVMVQSIPSSHMPSKNESSQYEEDQALRSELDGFMLLEITGMGFPEDARQALLVDKKLTSVVPDDLVYFTKMSSVDVSENRLQLYPFGAFPSLKELRIACNGIVDIGELLGFQNLLYLDLSYNKLKIDSVASLEVIPNLKELDLSGNDMGGIPDDFGGFKCLEKIILDYNKIEDNNCFYALSTARSLRHISLANNFLSSIPSNAGDHDAFMRLELLDISFNYFGTDESVDPAIAFPRITALVLYGNPLLGPTGEDPMYVYIDDMIERAADIREQSKSSLPDIDFVTEIPRRRVLKKGQPMGRQATYRDFSIVQVEQSNIGTNREWRQLGMQTIFAETMEYKKQQQQQQKQQLQSNASTSSLPDFTFITNSAAVANPTSNQSIGSLGIGGHSNSLDIVADDVMKRVAEELGLVNSAELLRLKDKAMLPRSATSLLEEAMEKSSNESDGMGTLGALLYPDASNLMAGNTSSLNQPSVHLAAPDPAPYNDNDNKGIGGVKEQIPDTLFNRTLGEPQQVAAHPIPLKTAVKALRGVLRQPLTSYDEVPAKSSQGPAQEIHRSTKSSRLRQMPRHPNASVSNAPQASKEAAGADGTEDFLDKKTHKYNRRGMREAKELAETRQLNRDRTLSQIDEVLHGLNENTAMWSERQHKIHNRKGQREQMKEMRNFVQPFNGIKGLVDMVEEVTKEFNS